MLVAVDATNPVDGLDERRDPDRHQSEEEATVQVGPGDHHERQPVDRARLAAEVAIEPEQLEAREGEGDHLRARSPDLGAAEAGDPDHDRGDDRVGRLEAHPPPDEQEADERHRREPKRHEGQSTDLEEQVRDDLGGVLGVDPLLARHREREEILRHHLVVIDHPLPGDEVPEDVGVTAPPDDHAEDAR